MLVYFVAAIPSPKHKDKHGHAQGYHPPHTKVQHGHEHGHGDCDLRGLPGNGLAQGTCQEGFICQADGSCQSGGSAIFSKLFIL